VTRVRCLAALAAILSIASPAWAKEPCVIRQLASLDLATEPDGEVAVPATIDGHEGLIEVDTGGAQSILGATFANKLQLALGYGNNWFMLYGGVPLGLEVKTHSFELGGLRAEDLALLVAPFTALHNDTVGVLAPDIMSNYDVELDFVSGKFNLFEPNDCPQAPVYWTKGAYAAVPFDTDRDDHILIDITLDGQSLTAGVDTGADRTTMSLADFKRLFDKSADDPALKLVRSVSINGTVSTKVYRYPFQTMMFEGIRIDKPNVDIVERGSGMQNPQIILGIETLRQLHLYIAYKAGKLYLTPAEAR
jgi:predicted aspartyl protease